MKTRGFLIVAASLLASRIRAEDLHGSEEGAAGLTFTSVPASQFPDSVAPGALRRVCAADVEALRAFFASKGIEFRDELVQRDSNGFCHLYFVPSLPGFRAATEEQIPRELSFAISDVTLIEDVGLQEGSSADIFRQLLSKLPKGPKIRLFYAQSYSKQLSDAALKKFLGAREADVEVVRVRADTDAWMQDAMKVGSIQGKPVILTPRHLYEGRAQPEDWPLDALKAHGAKSSSLAWEGGDQLFVQDPRDSTKTLAVVGRAAPWSNVLNPEEYRYVIGHEFGADDVFVVPTNPSHVDYGVTFVPEQKVAILAVPLRGDRSVVCEALREAQALLNKPAPFPQPHQGRVTRMIAEICTARILDARLAARLKSLVAELEPALNSIYVDSRIEQDFLKRVKVPACEKAADKSACLSGFIDTQAGREFLLARHPDLARRMFVMNQVANIVVKKAFLYLSMAQKQFEAVGSRDLQPYRELEAELTRRGFRVVRVPKLEADVAWAGLSPVNLLKVKDQLFVPQFGLPQFEARVLSQMRAAVRGMTVTPIQAGSSMMDDGGVHCRTGIVR